MGVDISEFLLGLVGEFIWIVLYSYLQIWFTSVLFFSCLGIFFHLSLRVYSRNPKWQVLGFFLVSILVWIHSVITYPQLYGEFFFIRYPSLTPFLFLLTDHVSPLWIQIVFYGIFIVHFLFLFFGFMEANDSEASFALVFGSSLLIFHFWGSLLGLFFLLVSFPYLYIYWNQIRFSPRICIFLFILVFGFFPRISEEIQFWSQSSENDKPNIILLSSDSLRLDRLGFVSGNSEISPAIDAFSRESMLFMDHHVTIPRTFPSWADLLTGEFSMSHGIRDMFPAPSEKRNIGNSRFPTIPQVLRSVGYRSAVVGNFAADIFPRASFGFDTVDCPDFNAKILTLQRGLDSQLILLPILTGSFLGGGTYISEVNGLSNLGDGSRIFPKFRSLVLKNSHSPLFLVQFSSVVHFPYTPPYPYYKKFTNPEYYGKYKYLKFVDPSVDEKPNPEEISQIRGLFDSSIYAYDGEFSKTIQFLKEKGIYENSWVILTADHGESLFEDIHGQGHGEHLRGENVTKVPLLIKPPGNSAWSKYAGQKYTGITSSLDLFPSILEMAGLSEPELSGKPGVSLFAQWKNPDQFKDRMVFSETGIWFSDRGDHFFQSQRIPYPNILELHKVVPEENYEIMITDKHYRETIAFSKHRSLQSSQYKLIYIPTREGVVYELYDRVRDPENQTNIFSSSQIGNRMRKEIQELILNRSASKRVGEYIIPTDLP
jgi:arylsulfatase A-like enzyme